MVPSAARAILRVVPFANGRSNTGLVRPMSFACGDLNAGGGNPVAGAAHPPPGAARSRIRMFICRPRALIATRSA